MSIALSNMRDRDRVLIIEAGRLNPSLPFARASSGTSLGGSGSIVTSANNVPRFEYDSSGFYKGLLVEEQRTNLVRYSQDLTNLAWAKTAVSATASAYNYKGIPYYTVAKTTTGSSATISQSAGAVSSNSVITLSAAVRAGNTTSMSLGLFDFTSGGTVWGDFANSSAKIISGLGSLTQSNGALWILTGLSTSSDTVVSVTRTYTANGTALARLYPAQHSSVANGASNLIAAVQVESGLSTTSYIPTTSAAVTRSSDILSATLAALGISATAGTFVIEHDVPSGNPLLCSGSNTILNSSGGSKVALSYDGSGWSKSMDGGAVTTGSALTFSSTLDIGKSSTTSANGHIKRLIWYRGKKPNQELQRYST